jgi:hypothetical protein
MQRHNSSVETKLESIKIHWFDENNALFDKCQKL